MPHWFNKCKVLIDNSTHVCSYLYVHSVRYLQGLLSWDIFHFTIWETEWRICASSTKDHLRNWVQKSNEVIHYQVGYISFKYNWKLLIVKSKCTARLFIVIYFYSEEHQIPPQTDFTSDCQGKLFRYRLSQSWVNSLATYSFTCLESGSLPNEQMGCN